MNGATDEPPPITIKTPSNNKTIIIGINQYFFRSEKKSQRSFNKSFMSDLNKFRNTNKIKYDLYFQ